MAQRVFSSAHREVLWMLTSGSWRTRTLPADNLDDPEVYLLGKGLAEVVGRQIAGNAGWLRTPEADRARAMSDRLALANAIEDAGIERRKAERVASVIFERRLLTRLGGLEVVTGVILAALRYWLPGHGG